MEHILILRKILLIVKIYGLFKEKNKIRKIVVSCRIVYRMIIINIGKYRKLKIIKVK